MNARRANQVRPPQRLADSLLGTDGWITHDRTTFFVSSVGEHQSIVTGEANRSTTCEPFAAGRHVTLVTLQELPRRTSVRK